jgi:dCTP deaminase
MSIKTGHWIKQMAEKGMIHPFSIERIQNTQATLGCTYSISCEPKFDIFDYAKPMRWMRYAKDILSIARDRSTVIDPKNFTRSHLRTVHGDTCIIPPHSVVLGCTIERFSMPRDVLTLCFGLPMYAECGIIANVTPLEPEWKGQLTVELSNTNSKPVKIYANEPIAQLIFFEADTVCEVSYGDRKGKYQNQAGITVAEV